MANPLGNITGGVVGAGVGIAASNVAEPVLEVERQQAWKDNAYRVLDFGALAQLVASGLVELDDAAEQAQRNGYSKAKLAARVQLELEAPSVAEVLELWRRNPSRPANEQITEAQVDHALAKAKVEPQYWVAIKELFSERLDPAVIAVAIQRGIMRDPGFLPVPPPAGAGKVKPFPVSELDPLIEAISSGVTKDRLFVETAIVGNPASPDLAARMTFRNIIEKDDFLRAISEGNTRNEWADVLFEGFREILTANQYTELELRGFTDRDQRLRDTAKHGMSDEDSDKLFDVLGRAPSIHQVVIGLARGGKYPGSYANVPEPFRSAIQRGNIREEWAEIVYAERFTYPTGFQIRSEAQTGGLTKDETNEILLEIGWSPKWADRFSAKWTAPTTSTASSPSKKAETSLLTVLHKAYVEDRETEVTVRDGLGFLGVEAAEQNRTIEVWNRERALIRASLSAAQIKKAVGQAGHDRSWAVDRLLELGYSGEDATALLDE